MIIPTNPNRPPPSRIENTTQNADNPVELPKNLRSDHISIKLLQYKNEDQEIQALDRIIQQNQNGTRNSTDIRSEERNDIGHTNDYTDQKVCTASSGA